MSPGFYFGTYDEQTGGRILTNEDATIFYNKITEGWSKNVGEYNNEIVNADGSIVRVSQDGTVRATFGKVDGKDVVSFYSSEASFTPFNNIQTITFVE